MLTDQHLKLCSAAMANLTVINTLLQEKMRVRDRAREHHFSVSVGHVHTVQKKPKPLPKNLNLYLKTGAYQRWSGCNGLCPAFIYKQTFHNAYVIGICFNRDRLDF